MIKVKINKNYRTTGLIRSVSGPSITSIITEVRVFLRSKVPNIEWLYVYVYGKMNDWGLSGHPSPAVIPSLLLDASGSLALEGCVSLMRFVEFSQELNLRHERVNLFQYVVFHSQICIVIPNLENRELINKSFSISSYITWIMSSLSLGDTDSPQISSPLARASSNCSPMDARSNSFQTIGVSCFLHFILQVPPLQIWGSSHSGGLSSRIKW